jgi:hypothetical protein
MFLGRHYLITDWSYFHFFQYYISWQSTIDIVLYYCIEAGEILRFSSKIKTVIWPSEIKTVIWPSEIKTVIWPSKIKTVIWPSKIKTVIWPSEIKTVIWPSEIKTVIWPSEIKTVIWPSEIKTVIWPSEIKTHQRHHNRKYHWVSDNEKQVPFLKSLITLNKRCKIYVINSIATLAIWILKKNRMYSNNDGHSLMC